MREERVLAGDALKSALSRASVLKPMAAGHKIEQGSFCSFNTDGALIQFSPSAPLAGVAGPLEFNSARSVVISGHEVSVRASGDCPVGSAVALNDEGLVDPAGSHPLAGAVIVATGITGLTLSGHRVEHCVLVRSLEPFGLAAIS